MGVEKVEVGAEIPLHHHDNAEEIVFITHGQALAFVNDEQKQVTVGDALFLPRGARHRIINTGQEPLWITYTFSPPVGLKLST